MNVAGDRGASSDRLVDLVPVDLLGAGGGAYCRRRTNRQYLNRTHLMSSWVGPMARYRPCPSTVRHLNKNPLRVVPANVSINERTSPPCGCDSRQQPRQMENDSDRRAGQQRGDHSDLEVEDR